MHVLIFNFQFVYVHRLLFKAFIFFFVTEKGGLQTFFFKRYILLFRTIRLFGIANFFAHYILWQRLIFIKLL